MIIRLISDYNIYNNKIKCFCLQFMILYNYIIQFMLNINLHGIGSSKKCWKHHRHDWLNFNYKLINKKIKLSIHSCISFNKNFKIYIMIDNILAKQRKKLQLYTRYWFEISARKKLLIYGFVGAWISNRKYLYSFEDNE